MAFGDRPIAHLPGCNVPVSPHRHHGTLTTSVLRADAAGHLQSFAAALARPRSVASRDLQGRRAAPIRADRGQEEDSGRSWGLPAVRGQPDRTEIDRAQANLPRRGVLTLRPCCHRSALAFACAVQCAHAVASHSRVATVRARSLTQVGLRPGVCALARALRVHRLGGRRAASLADAASIAARRIVPDGAASGQARPRMESLTSLLVDALPDEALVTSHHARRKRAVSRASLGCT